jgi:hypothetical protein
VSTAETNENDVFAGRTTVYGQHFSYGFGLNSGGPVSNAGGSWLATRSSSGWLSTNQTLAGDNESGTNTVQPRDVSNDGSQVLYITDKALDPADTNGELDLYLSGPEGSYTWLTAGATRGPYASGDNNGEGVVYAGRSSDFSHVIFEASRELLPGMPASPTGAELYEWVAGQLRVVGVLPDGSIPAGGAVPGNTQSVGGIEFVEHAISSDGSRIFFESPDPVVEQAEGTPRQLYVRIKGERTVEVSAPTPGVSDPNGPRPATFMAASADGSVVFFTSHGKLTVNANTGVYDEGANLYEYELSSGRLTDLTVDTGDEVGAQVQGVLGVSKDGSEIYFAALGALTPNADVKEGESHLYRENTSTGEVTYITTLSRYGDASDWIAQDGEGSVSGGGPTNLAAYVAPDGRHLLFWSKESLTGYDNLNVASGEPGREIYEYDASGAGTLACVSCDPSGLPPTGETYFGEAPMPLLNGAHNMTDDGSEVVFVSENRLLPRATNGFSNVYEWERGGSGSCQASAASCLYLISTGSSPDPNLLFGVSPDGTDVYFAVPDRLVPQDQNENLEVYDARAGGGFSQVPSSACSGTGCQGVPSASPIFATPSSVTFGGVGNFSATSTPQAANTAKVMLVKKSVKRSTITLTVRVPARGRITVSGTAVKTVARSVSKAGAYAVKVSLTTGAKQRLRQRSKLKTKLRVGYAPSSGSSSSTTVSMTVKA